MQLFDFSLTVTPMSGSVSKGDSVLFTVSVAHVSGSVEPVWLTVSGLPSASKSFSNDNGKPSFTSPLTVDTGILTMKGVHTITITAYNEDWTRTREFDVDIDVS